jgi:ribosome-associated heat shock protein Hsp15
VSSGVRIDKWLWAARFFKTRSLAAEAVTGGKVKLNGERTKAAKVVRVGDELFVHIGAYEYVVTVQGLAERRGPAKEAVLLYEESPESRARREALAAQLSLERKLYRHQEVRPTKKERRALIRLKRGDD